MITEEEKIVHLFPTTSLPTHISQKIVLSHLVRDYSSCNLVKKSLPRKGPGNPDHMYRATSFADSVMGDELYPTQSEMADYAIGRTKSQRKQRGATGANPNGQQGGSDAARQQALQQEAVGVCFWRDRR